MFADIYYGFQPNVVSRDNSYDSSNGVCIKISMRNNYPCMLLHSLLEVSILFRTLCGFTNSLSQRVQSDSYARPYNFGNGVCVKLSVRNNSPCIERNKRFVQAYKCLKMFGNQYVLKRDKRMLIF